MIHEVIGS